MQVEGAYTVEEVEEVEGVEGVEEVEEISRFVYNEVFVIH